MNWKCWYSVSLGTLTRAQSFSKLMIRNTRYKILSRIEEPFFCQVVLTHHDLIAQSHATDRQTEFDGRKNLHKKVIFRLRGFLPCQRYCTSSPYLLRRRIRPVTGIIRPSPKCVTFNRRICDDEFIVIQSARKRQMRWRQNQFMWVFCLPICSGIISSALVYLLFVDTLLPSHNYTRSQHCWIFDFFGEDRRCHREIRRSTRGAGRTYTR